MIEERVADRNIRRWPCVRRERDGVAMLLLAFSTLAMKPLGYERCLPFAIQPKQQFAGSLKIHIDDWESSRVLAFVAQILLTEREGFVGVELEGGNASASVSSFHGESDVRQRIAQGDQHMAFEVWPAFVEDELAAQQQWASFNQSSTSRAWIFGYDDWAATWSLYMKGSSPSTSLAAILETPAGLEELSRNAVSTGSTEAQALCADSAYACDADGIFRPAVCRANGSACAQVLMNSPGDPGARTVEAMIEEAALPLTIAYVDKQVIADAAWRAHYEAEPVLFTWYAPTAPLNGIFPAEAFRTVQLSPSSTWPSGTMQKLAWPGLAEAGGTDALALLRAFQMKASDYEQMLTDQATMRDDTQDGSWLAACAWLKNNPTTWAPWIEFPSRPSSTWATIVANACFRADDCYNGNGRTAAGWWFFALQISLGTLLVLRRTLRQFLKLLWQTLICERCRHAKAIRRKALGKVASNASLLKQGSVKLSKRLVAGKQGTPTTSTAVTTEVSVNIATIEKNVSSAALEASSTIGMTTELAAKKLAHSMEAAVEFQKQSLHMRYILMVVDACHALMSPTFETDNAKHEKWMRTNPVRCKKAPYVFTSHVRDFDNFARSNVDPGLVKPPGTVLEVEGLPSSATFLCKLLRDHMQIRETILTSAGFGFLVAGTASFLWCAETYQLWEDEQWGGEQVKDIFVDVIAPLDSAISSTSSDFRFFVSFGVLGLLGFFLGRWRNFIFAAWRVEGRLKDLSIMIGSSVVDPNDPRSKEFLFRYYRYIVAVMALQYKTLITDFKGGIPFPKMLELGMLTPEEVALLEPTGSRARDTVTAWLGVLAMRGQAEGILHNFPMEKTFEKIADMRGNMMFFHGNNFFPMSHLWTAMVYMVVNIWSAIIIIGGPFSQYVQPNEELGWLAALQPWAFISIFMLLLTFWGTLAVCEILAKPFATDTDTFNIDALIGGTEETVFANLRAGFNFVPLDKKHRSVTRLDPSMVKAE